MVIPSIVSCLWHVLIKFPATGVLWLTQISATSPWVAGSINFTAPYFWLSLALNMTMTIAICARLLFFRTRVRKVLGHNHGSDYTSIAAMVVESAAIYSAFSLCFLIPFALNHPIQNTFIQMLGEVQVSIVALYSLTDTETTYYRSLPHFLSHIGWPMGRLGRVEPPSSSYPGTLVRVTLLA